MFNSVLKNQEQICGKHNKNQQKNAGKKNSTLTRAMSTEDRVFHSLNPQKSETNNNKNDL